MEKADAIMKLDFYFAKRFMSTLLGLFLLFFAFYVLLDMVEELRQFDVNKIGFLSILHLTALNVPAGLYRILPLIVILATITMFLNLARKSELVVTRAAGRSALRSLVAPVLVAFLLGCLAVAMFNPIVAATTKQYETVASRYSERKTSVLSISKEGLWLRQGNEDGQIVIRAERSNLDGTHLFAVSFVAFSNEGAPTYRVEAESAMLTEGAWVLENTKKWDFVGTGIPEQTATKSPKMKITSDLTPDQIRDSFGTPSAIPVWELPSFINRLERAGFSARQHRVLAANGIGFAADALCDGDDWGRFYHAPHTLWQDRHDGAPGDPYRIHGLLHPKFLSDSWRKWSNTNHAGRLGHPYSRGAHDAGTPVTSGGWMTARLLLALVLSFFGLAASAASDNTSLLADRVEIVADKTIVASGNVEILYQDYRLRAPLLIYDSEAETLTIEGPITLQQGDRITVLADSAELDRAMANGIMRSARLVLDQQLQIAATEIHRVDGRYSQLYQAVASSCQVCADNPVPLWQIPGKEGHSRSRERVNFIFTVRSFGHSMCR